MELKKDYLTVEEIDGILKTINKNEDDALIREVMSVVMSVIFCYTGKDVIKPNKLTGADCIAFYNELLKNNQLNEIKSQIRNYDMIESLYNKAHSAKSEINEILTLLEQKLQTFNASSSDIIKGVLSQVKKIDKTNNGTR